MKYYRRDGIKEQKEKNNKDLVVEKGYRINGMVYPVPINKYQFDITINN